METVENWVIVRGTYKTTYDRDGWASVWQLGEKTAVGFLRGTHDDAIAEVRRRNLKHPRHGVCYSMIRKKFWKGIA